MDVTFPAHWDSSYDLAGRMAVTPAFLARTHPDATVYHQPEWLAVMEGCFGYVPHHLGLDDRAFLPLFLVPGVSGRRLVSSPFRDRGGALAADPAALTDILGQAVARARRLGAALVIKQAADLPPGIAEAAGLVRSAHWVTTVVDLSDGAQALWASLGNNAQGPVKQARKAGVTVREAASPAEWAAFAAIFDRTRHQLGIPTFPPAFFAAMAAGPGAAGHARLLLAELDGRPIAGLVLLVHGGVAIDGYAASLPAYRHTCRPNDLLVWTAIERAAELGCHTFDFGADSPLQEGLLAFKRKWRGIQRVLPHYTLGGDGAMDGSAARFDLPRRLLAAAPLPVFRWLSRLAVARFG